MASVAGFAGALDLSMMFVAYPDINDAFPATSPAVLSWVVTVYSIVLAALLIPSGRLADRLGRRRLFLTGIAVFGVGALASGLAPGPMWLIAARAAQAVGGAMVLPASMGVLLADPMFRAANVVAFTFSAAFFAMFFGLVLFVTEVWDEPGNRAGLFVIPAQVTAAVTSFGGGKLIDRLGHRRVMVPGALAFATGSLLLATAVGDTRSLGIWTIALVLMGAGVGTVFPSFQSGAVHAVPSRKFGIAAATTQTNIRVAGTLGVAVAVALVGGMTTSDAGTFDPLWWMLTGLAVVSAVGSWRIDTRRPTVDTVPAPSP